MAVQQQAGRSAALSDMTALRLLRANMNDKKGTKPVNVDGFSWERFSALVAEKNATPPLGSKSAKHVAEEQGIPESAADKLLRAQVAKGNMESGIFKDGGYRRSFFWPKVAKKK